MLSHTNTHNDNICSPEAISDYKSIIAYAMAQNHQALSDLLDQSVCVDIRCGDCTPVQKLASENEFDAVDFLLVNFGASYQEAITGYAIAGNTTRVNSLLNKGAFALDAIRGYAQGGHSEACERLIHKVTNKLEQPQEIECQLAALEGYCLSENIPKINEVYHSLRLMTQWQATPKTNCYDKLAIQGHHFFIPTLSIHLQTPYHFLYRHDYIAHHYVLNMMALHNNGHKHINNNMVNIDYIQHGYALREPHKITQINQPDYIRTLAFAGHYEMVAKLLKRGGCPYQAILGFAAGGHSKYVMKSLENHKVFQESQYLATAITHALYAYGRYGHIKEGEALLLDTITNPLVIHHLLFGGLYVGGYVTNKTILMRTLSLFSSAKVRSMLLDKLFQKSFRKTCISKIPNVHPSLINTVSGWKNYLMFSPAPPSALAYRDFLDNQANENVLKMESENLNFAQIHVWRSSPVLRAWMLSSFILVHERGMPRDIFNIITAKAFDLRIVDMLVMYEKFCIPIFKQLLKMNLKQFSQKYQSSLFDDDLLSFVKMLGMVDESLDTLTPKSINQSNVVRANRFFSIIAKTDHNNSKVAAANFATAVHTESQVLNRRIGSLFEVESDVEYQTILRETIKRL